MLTASKKGLKINHNGILQKAKRSPRLYIHHYPAKDIKQAIVSLQAGNCPLEELIAVGEATFAFIYSADIELQIKNSFIHLERLFDFYKNLLQSGNKKIIITTQD